MGMKQEKKGGRRDAAEPSTTMTVASSSSSSFRASPCTEPFSPLFTPISEQEEMGRTEVGQVRCFVTRARTPDKTYKHQPTPLHCPASRASGEEPEDDDGGRSVSCNKCRPSSRDKISIVPLDPGRKRASSAIPTLSPVPNGLFKNIFSSLTRKSPRPGDSSSSAASSVAGKEEHWKLALAELSHKLLQASRKRDEALVEAARLKLSVSELEKKLDKLELYCRDLRSGLDVCTGTETGGSSGASLVLVVEPFLRAVGDARGGVRQLSRSLALQLRQAGAGKVAERVAALLQPQEPKASAPSRHARSLVFYMEALLNRAFYDDFESSGFQKGVSNPILGPKQRCEANFAAYTLLRGLTWDEVLIKGTRHFSEDFSRFCDRKMSEIVGMLGWSRAWPEAVLQAFFGAAKGVWLVHLLAFAVHPSLPIFRVEKGTKFDGGYMEDLAGGVGSETRRLVPGTVLAMVAPGFYVHSSVVKCKVLCRYNQHTKGTAEGN